MELHIQPLFDCALLVNGAFFEPRSPLELGEYDVLYVTALPTDCALLPYTVKLVGAQPVHTELALGLRLSDGLYVLELAPRRPVLYSFAPPPPPATPIARLFAAVKAGELDRAFSMLTDRLKADIDRATLAQFFARYSRLVECSWDPASHIFYLVDNNGNAVKHNFTLVNDLIDDLLFL